MNIPGIQIQQQSARLGTDIEPHQLEIGLRMDNLEIRTENSQLEIDSRPVDVEIDMTEMKQDIGLYNFRDRMQVRVQESIEIAHEAIARYGQVGDRLMDFQNNDIADIAFEEMLDDDVTVELGYISPPDFSVQPAELQASLRRAEYEGQSQMAGELNRPDYRFESGRVNIYLRQSPELEIMASGRHLDEQA